MLRMLIYCFAMLVAMVLSVVIWGYLLMVVFWGNDSSYVTLLFIALVASSMGVTAALVEKYL